MLPHPSRHLPYNHALPPPIPNASPPSPGPSSSSPAHLPSRSSHPLSSSTPSLVSPSLFFRPALAFASSPRGARWELRGGRGLAALQPRQAQSPPDKPLNRVFTRGAAPFFLARTPSFGVLSPGLMMPGQMEPPGGELKNLCDEG